LGDPPMTPLIARLTAATGMESPASIGASAGETAAVAPLGARHSWGQVTATGAANTSHPPIVAGSSRTGFSGNKVPCGLPFLGRMKHERHSLGSISGEIQKQ